MPRFVESLAEPLTALQSFVGVLGEAVGRDRLRAPPLMEVCSGELGRVVGVAQCFGVGGSEPAELLLDAFVVSVVVGERGGGDVRFAADEVHAVVRLDAADDGRHDGASAASKDLFAAQAGEERVRIAVDVAPRERFTAGAALLGFAEVGEVVLGARAVADRRRRPEAVVDAHQEAGTQASEQVEVLPARRVRSQRAGRWCPIRRRR
ncbi:MAG: hypothetical protein R3B99_31600 [Polyangiales bacterium]